MHVFCQVTPARQMRVGDELAKNNERFISNLCRNRQTEGQADSYDARAVRRQNTNEFTVNC